MEHREVGLQRSKEAGSGHLPVGIQDAFAVRAEIEAAELVDLPQFVKDEFDALLECGILARGFLRWRCGDCEHDRWLRSPASGAASAPRVARGAMARTAAHLIDLVTPALVQSFLEAE